MAPTDKDIALIITERKPFGYLLIPYFVDRTLSPIIKLNEQITPSYYSTHKENFSEPMQMILTNLIELHDQKLYKRFSKEKNIKAFYDKLEQTTIDKFISPFIDHIIQKVLPLIIENDIAIYPKENGYNNTNESRRVIISPTPSMPRLFFTLSDKGFLSYKLKIANNGNDISLYNKQLKELSINPAVIIVENHLYYFEDIDAKMFRTFTKREHIIYNSSQISMVMEGFVRKCIEKYRVSSYGFDIRRKDVACKPILSIENTPLGYNFCLAFDYGQHKYAYKQLRRVVNMEQEGGRYTFGVCNRDISSEEKTINILSEIGLHPTTSMIMQCNAIEKSSSIYPLIEWLNQNYNYISENGIEIKAIEITGYYTGKIDLQMNVDNKIDWFDIYGTVILDGYTIPFIKLRNNIINGTREYILPDGKIFIIPTEWFTRWSDIFNFAKEDGEKIVLNKMHSTLIPPEILRFESDKDTILEPTQTERCGELKATLRPYQEDGVRWLITLYENKMGGILADDMGLGKTLQTIALLSHVYSKEPLTMKAFGSELNLFNCQTTIKESTATLIVVPVSLIHNWLNEIKRFAPQLSVVDYNHHRNRNNTLTIEQLSRHCHIILTSYGLLRNDIENFSRSHFKYLIIDESQNAKNASSKTYKSLLKIDAEYHLNISGTPIENGLNDLWSQMNLVNRGLLGNQTFFNTYFNEAICKRHDEQRESKLQRVIAPFILRRTKEKVAKDLPPITEQVIYCLMSESQKEIYESEKSSFRNEILCNIERDIKSNPFMALQAMMRMRLIANHPILVQNDYTGTSGKFDVVMDNIRNVASEGHKMLLFSSFVRDLSLIAKQLSKEKIGYAMLTGSTTKREYVIDDFMRSDKKVFLISLKAGGVGLNLTCAEYVFVLNPWWNPAAEQQAISRAHRIGQTKNVFVYRFITSETIEEKIQILQQKKLQLSGTFVPTDNPINDLTVKELEELL